MAKILLPNLLPNFPISALDLTDTLNDAIGFEVGKMPLYGFG